MARSCRSPILRSAVVASSGALFALLLSSACVSTPGQVGPVQFEGPVAIGTGERATRAAPVPGATQGPLLMRDATLTVAGGRYRWSATLENPSDGTFEVTLVVTLLDDRGATLAYQTRELELDRGDERGLDGALATTGAPVRFRIEYWVRLPPPPDRRLERDRS